jgi:SAM-dependent methyltransferase
MTMDEHRATNLANWESRVPIHAASQLYDLEHLAADPGRLSNVMRRDAPELGDVAGLDVVHLQCHIGTESVSLAKLGARVTAVDFSPSALAVAQDLAHRAGVDVRFVESEVYAAPAALAGDRFDLVYTSVGVLCWLPDIRGWARVVAALLRPGGRLYLREGHPVLWSLDDERADELLVIQYPYFERREPTRFATEVTYADGDARVSSPVTYEWNHGLGEIVQALLDAGMVLTRLVEHDAVEWQALPWMVRGDDGRFRLPSGGERLPLSYTLEARLPT